MFWIQICCLIQQVFLIFSPVFGLPIYFLSKFLKTVILMKSNSSIFSSTVNAFCVLRTLRILQWQEELLLFSPRRFISLAGIFSFCHSH